MATILFPAFFRAAGLGMDERELPMYFDTSSAISIQAINRKGDRHG